MNLMLVLLAIALAYFALSFDFVVNADKRWRARSNRAKIAKAGTLAALKTLRSFLQVALVTLAAVLAIALVAEWISPFLGAAALHLLRSAAQSVKDIAKPISTALGTLGFALGLAGLFWLATKLRSDQLRRMLQEEYARQSRALAEAFHAGKFEMLPPSDEMQRIAELIDQIDRAIATGAGQADLFEQRATLLQLYQLADFDRRIDLNKLPILETPKQGFWPRAGLFLFSEGFNKLRENVARNIGRVATAATCIALIGVSAPVIASGAAQPVLATILDLQVMRSAKDAKADLGKMAEAPPVSAASTASNYQPIATELAHNIAAAIVDHLPSANQPDAPDVSVVEPVARPVDVDEVAVREAVLKEYAKSARTADVRAETAISENAAPEAEQARTRYAAFQAELAPGPSPAGDRKIARWLGWIGDRHPGIKAKLDAFAASTAKPRTIRTFEEAVLSEFVSKILETALPEPKQAMGEFASSPVTKAGRKSAESGISDFALRALDQFLHDIAGPRDVRSALEKVRQLSGEGIAFTSSEMEALDAYAKGLWKDKAQVASILAEREPALVGKPTEKGVAERLAKALGPNSSSGFRNEVVGGFDDLFPGTLRDSLSASAVDGKLAEAAIARDFAALSKNPHVGGVVIGRKAEGIGQFIDLRWQRKGSDFILSLVAKNGAITRLGTFNAAILQQAIAYAADGRQAAVTIVNTASGSAVQKIHLHPVFQNTALGCLIIDLDGLVFKGTGADPAWAEWSTRVDAQVELYGDAIAVLRDGEQPLRRFKNLHWVFPAGWSAADRNVSVFASEPGFFSRPLVQALADCAGKTASEDLGYWLCVRQNYLADPHGLDPTGSRQARALAISKMASPDVHLLSGVREKAFTPTGPNFVLPAGSYHRTLQFSYLAVVPGAATNGREAWAFPMLGNQAERMVDRLTTSGTWEDMVVQRALEFTAAQRVARAALYGSLGQDFPRARLLQLLREARAAQPVQPVPTPVWNNDRAKVVSSRATLKTAFAKERDRLVQELTQAIKPGTPSTTKARITRCIAAIRQAGVETFDSAAPAKTCELPPGIFGTLSDTARAYRFNGALIETQPAATFKDGARCERLQAAARFSVRRD